MLAGNHLAMICHRVHMIEEARAALEKVDRAALDRALAGVDRFKRKMAAPKPFSEERFRALDQRSLGVARRHPWGGGRGPRSPDDGKRRRWKFTER